MSSLQEQLLKAGLVDEKKLAAAERDRNKQASLARKQRGKQAPKAKANKPSAQTRKAQRDRELNQKRKEEARRKELAAQAQQLVDQNKQDRSKGELPYSFVYRSKVKKIYVTETQRKQLADGQLGIVTFVARDGRTFELVPSPVLEKIRQRDPGFVVDADRGSTAQPDENDPYADYQVPDDLIW